MDQEFVDEILERIWIMEEKGVSAYDEIANKYPSFFLKKLLIM